MGYIYGFDGDGFTSICLTQTHQAVYINFVQLFIGQSYLNKVEKNEKYSHMHITSDLVFHIAGHSCGPFTLPNKSSATCPKAVATYVNSRSILEA